MQKNRLLLLVIVSVWLVGCGVNSRTPTQDTSSRPLNGQVQVVTLTTENFDQEVLDSDIPVMVDVWATWCGPCRHMTPIVEEIAADFSGQAKVGKLDIDQNGPIADRYNIRGVPAFLFFRNGKLVNQELGVQPKEILASHLQPGEADQPAEAS